jgi:hypothetical protein
MGTEIISRRVKRPGLDVDLVEVKNEWRFTSAPFTCLNSVHKEVCFMGIYYRMVGKLVKKERKFVEIGRGLIKEIFPYFPAGTTES